MKKLYTALVLVSFSLIAFHCQKEIRTANGNSIQPPLNPDLTTSSPVTAVLQGNVYDENDLPAAGVLIKVGTQSATTNSQGQFRISNAKMDKNLSLVTGEKSGYFKAYRSFNPTNAVNQVYLKLTKKALAGSINSSVGGTVSTNKGANVSIPANAVVFENGGAYNGSVRVYAAFIDPTATDIARTVPGSFMATDDNNKVVLLSSYGMLNVELESDAGDKLQLKKGFASTLNFPIPSNLQSSAPATIPLWWLDPEKGTWKEEGRAQKNGSTYIGEVKHFTPWNVDAPSPNIVSFTATIKNNKGVPVTFTQIRFRLSGGVITSTYAVSDSLGQVNGFIPMGTELVLEVLNQCGGVVYSQNVGPFSSPADFGTITISSGSSLVTIKGKIVNCNNEAVGKGYAVVSFDNVSRHVATNSAGEFSITVTSCPTSPSTCQVVPVDQVSAQQGSTADITITMPETNAGTLVACGISTLQFVNYTLDGSAYGITSTAGDSLLAYSVTPGYTLPMRVSIMGARMPSSYIGINVDCNAAIGTYTTVNDLHVQQYNRATPINPFKVSFTRFPQTVGDYYEGNFQGSFKDTSNLSITHTLNGSFRLMKNW